jgi:choline dehydrogenase
MCALPVALSAFRATPTRRGNVGPLTTAYGRKTNPLYDAFIEAGLQAGAVSADLNGEQQEGPLGMTGRDGVRWSPPTPISSPR